MGAIRKIAVAVLALGAFSFLGAMDYSDALIQEAMEKEARPQRVTAQELAPLSHPIPYKAVVCQSGPLEKPRCRFYTGEQIK